MADTIVKWGMKILPFFIFMLVSNFVCAQVSTKPKLGISTKNKLDTVSLSRFAYYQHGTNNGSACIYYLSNPSNATNATAVNIGAPDSLRFDDHSLFNGIHLLAPRQQIIAVGNFSGKQITTTNLSSTNTSITVMLFCPGN